MVTAADPGPKQLHRARRKLSTVTACSSVLSPVPPPTAAHNHDIEASAAQLDLGEW